MSASDAHERSVERPAAEVVDDDTRAPGADGLSLPVCVLEARRGRFVHQRAHGVSRAAERFEREPTLRSVRVCRDRDDGCDLAVVLLSRDVGSVDDLAEHVREKACEHVEQWHVQRADLDHRVRRDVGRPERALERAHQCCACGCASKRVEAEDERAVVFRDD